MPDDKAKPDPTRPEVAIVTGAADAGRGPPRRLSLPTPWRLPRPLLERGAAPDAGARRGTLGGTGPAIGAFDHHSGEHLHDGDGDEHDEREPDALALHGEAGDALAQRTLGEGAWQEDEEDDDSDRETRDTLDVFDDPAAAPTPLPVLELAASCVRFVATAFKVEPDFTPDTLPVVDHYLRDARAAVAARPESLALVAQAVGAYLGEVVRKGHACWWRTESEDPTRWRLDFRDVYVSFYPVELATALLLDPSGDFSGLELRDSVDREAVVVRLRDLPEVSAEEFELASTRLEVLDIAVDALSRRRIRDRSLRRIYRPEDYG
ncbi:MAG: hypothetical protein HY908_34370 [Myxococcales bacterium]|nr:hypothetical protein [Myxococcales bacterium]